MPRGDEDSSDCVRHMEPARSATFSRYFATRSVHPVDGRPTVSRYAQFKFKSIPAIHSNLIGIFLEGPTCRILKFRRSRNGLTDSCQQQ